MATQLKQALLVMDVQNTIVPMLKDHENLLKPIAAAVQSARAAKIPVIFVIIGFRKGYPEINPISKSFERIKNMGANFEIEGTKVAEQVAPLPDEVIVVKKRVSAFSGSDLELVLKSLGIQHLVLTGFATSGVVLSTLREAADKDYRVTVLSDGCADRDDQVHEVLIKKVFPAQADVVTSQEWATAIGGEAK
jgi:nicotinamidase-related amidase